MANSYHSEESSETSYKNNRPPKVEKVSDGMVKIYVWELPVRIFHWLNAGAILGLMITGIYIGNPFFASILQEQASSFIMGWIRYIHFFSAFLFSLNLLVRLYWVFTGNKYATSNPLRKLFWKDSWETVKFYLFMKNKKPHFVGHNPLAQLSYWAIIGGGSIVMILTGFYMYIEPQPESIWGKMFGWVAIFGDSFEIRSWHHLVAWVFMMFIIIHIYLSIREDYLEKNGTMSSIFTGYKTEPKHTLGEKIEKQLVGEDMTEDHRNQITILGIGNTLYTDEGLGVNVLSPLEEIYGKDEHVKLIDGSTDGMGLLGPVEDTDYLIIIDAINAGKEGGHIIELQGEEIPAYYGIKMSIHQLGFQEVLLASKLRENYPKNIVMLGMQPTSLELGIGLSETNNAKLPELVKLVEEQVNKWKYELV